MEKNGIGVALVTGASSGIGKAAAQALARAGYRVFGTSRRPSTSAIPGVTMLIGDVTSDESVKQVARGVVARAGRIDLLVNSAGRSLIGSAEDPSIAQAKSLFDVNVFGMLRMTNAVLPSMRSQGVGCIINMSPVFGVLPGPLTAFYDSARRAVEAYSGSLDHELRTFGIRVTLVEPALARTALNAGGIQWDPVSGAGVSVRPAMNAAWRDGVAKQGNPVAAVADAIVRAATDGGVEKRYASEMAAGDFHFVADQLARLIRSGALRPGDLLPSERDLVEVFSVDRHTIRAAMVVLEGRQMIGFVHGSRSRVLGSGGLEHVHDDDALKQVARPSTRELFEARLALDTQIAALSTGLITERELEQLERLAQLQLECRDGASVAVLDFVFHSRLYRSSRNRLLAELAMHIHGCLEARCRAGATRVEVTPDAASRSYQTLLAAVRSRSPHAASAAVRQQIVARMRKSSDLVRSELACPMERAAQTSGNDRRPMDIGSLLPASCSLPLRAS